MHDLHLRPHHLLCMQLFCGYGYSAAFSEQMRSIISSLRTCPAQRISLVFGPDDLCRACPHLKDGACSMGDASVLSMDHAAARALSLHEASYTYDALRRKLRCDLTRSGFERCCGSCSWYEKGVCSYAKLTAALFDENAQSMP